MKRPAQWNIADKEALLAAVEAFYTEHNRLPAPGGTRDKVERVLGYKYGKLRKRLEELDNGDPQVANLQARVQEFERRMLKNITACLPSIAHAVKKRRT